MEALSTEKAAKTKFFSDKLNSLIEQIKLLLQILLRRWTDEV